MITALVIIALVCWLAFLAVNDDVVSYSPQRRSHGWVDMVWPRKRDNFEYRAGDE